MCEVVVEHAFEQDSIRYRRYNISTPTTSTLFCSASSCVITHIIFSLHTSHNNRPSSIPLHCTALRCLELQQPLSTTKHFDYGHTSQVKQQSSLKKLIALRILENESIFCSTPVSCVDWIVIFLFTDGVE